jgi:hypothetical protein
MAVQSVDAVVAALAPAARSTAQALRSAARQAAPTLGEAVTWGNVCFVDADGRALVGLVPHRQHANLQLFNGAQLAAAFPELEGAGKGLRHLKCRYHAAVDTHVVGRIVRAALKQR